MVLPHRIKKFSYPTSSSSHGGSLSLGKRKNKRPVSSSQSMHIVMRSVQAHGKYSLLLPKHAKLVHHIINKYGKRFEVRVYNFAFVGNHIHLLIKSKTREGLQNFLRVVAGQTAQRITHAEKGSPLAKRFWDLLAFSRIIPWGRAYSIVKHYIHKNILQGAAITRTSWLTNTC